MNGDDASGVGIARGSKSGGRSVLTGAPPKEPKKSIASHRTEISLPDGLSLNEWRRIGHHINVIYDSSAWWLGDWLVYGQLNYPSRYRDVIAETSLDYQTLRNYAWVARRFPPKRRRERLSFQHHAEVASMADGEQDRWLDRAERDRMTRNELRSRIRSERDEAGDKLTMVNVNVAADRQQHWRQAADKAGMDLLEWIVATLDDAARGTAALDP
jgi:hypothetical protein